MLDELWLEVRGLRVAGDARGISQVSLEEADDRDLIVGSAERPKLASTPISGFHCLLVYRDAKQAESRRRITCNRYDRAGSVDYLLAYCHEREAPRRFRADRIVEIIDLESGEVLVGDEFLGRFALDDVQVSPWGWGLAPKDRASLIAGLNALIFMARCDGEWHPLEADVLPEFITSFWLRWEVMTELNVDEIIGYSKRLRPDAETFFGALLRCAEDRRLARLLQPRLAAMIYADGVVRDEELYWGQIVDKYLDEALA